MTMHGIYHGPVHNPVLRPHFESGRQSSITEAIIREGHDPFDLAIY